MTLEQARIAAENSESDEWRWRHQREAGALTHQFGVQFAWMTSRCGTARWTALWHDAPADAPRCTACSEISANSVETNVRAILAVVERQAVA